MEGKVGVHVGLMDGSAGGWTAGGVYTRVVANALLKCGGLPPGARLSLVAQADTPLRDLGLPIIELEQRSSSIIKRLRSRVAHAAERSVQLPWRLRQAAGLVDPWDPFHVARNNGVDVLLPVRVLAESAPQPGLAVVGWIADFQHRFLQEYFSEEDRRFRDQEFDRLVHASCAMLASSEDVQSHLLRFHPGAQGKAVLARFPSMYAFEPPLAPDPMVLERYGIPKRFMLVTNQLWSHKNHQVLVDAWGILARRGVHVPLVLTGTPADYRDPRNTTVSKILQGVAHHRLAGVVTLLGEVSRSELTTLMQLASVLIQPSRFEGWSTPVQDARALGVPVICSDLPVHREQAPDALGFFAPDAPEALAAVVEAAWVNAAPRQDQREALMNHQAVANAFGQALRQTLVMAQKELEQRAGAAAS